MAYLMPRASLGHRASASPTTGRNALAVLILTSVPALAGGSHDVEIKIFAGTMAIARTVRENCLGIEADEHFLEALRQRLQVIEADHPAFAPQAHAAAEALKQGLAVAPSRQAWCDAAFRLYGPDGTLMRGLLRR